MQRPRVAPSVKDRCNLNVIERRRNVRNDPENQPKSHPRRTNHHSHILTRKTQRDHAEEVQHPVHQERSVAIRHRVSVCNVSDLRLTRNRVCVCEVDLKGHRDEGIGEREHKVGTHCGEPAPDDHLVELEWWMALRIDVGHVDRQVEGETEEGYND